MSRTREIALETLLRQCLEHVLPIFGEAHMTILQHCPECNAYRDEPHADNCPGRRLLADVREVLSEILPGDTDG